jgi:hypothetical protein
VGRCVNHPDRETGYECMKHHIFMCEDCMNCRDPELYCKFRTSCTIWFLTKKNFNDEPMRKNEKPPQKCALEPGAKVMDSK